MLKVDKKQEERAGVTKSRDKNETGECCSI